MDSIALSTFEQGLWSELFPGDERSLLQVRPINAHSLATAKSVGDFFVLKMRHSDLAQPRVGDKSKITYTIKFL